MRAAIGKSRLTWKINCELCWECEGWAGLMKKGEPVPSARLIIQQGKASPAQTRAWERLWLKLIADCQREPQSENEDKND